MDSSPTPLPRTKPAWPEHEEVGADYIGEVIDGRYRILRRLAKGGMAHVFLGKDLTRKCHVALKLLHRTGSESRRRFEVEAQVLSNFQHPHVVRVIAYGHTPDDQPYMALEYLEGETLSQRLARGPLPWREVVELGVQIAGAVHALHRIGVIHRDIKPDNIMLAIGADRAAAKLIDLGLASVGTPFHEAQHARFASQVTQRHKTQLGYTIGTPAYLPPEAGACEAEPRLDVYSLGATLYQLCTQFLPVEDAQPIPALCPDSDAPEDLSRLLRAALERDVEDRLPSADHLRRGLEAILAAHPRTPSPGPLFGGCYDRLEVLGVGASAIVYRASDRELSREVALKVLRDARPSEDDTIRFRRAAKILSALHHPNIPQILHFGVDLSDPTRDQGQRFAVTQLCSGSPASAVSRPDRHLRPDEVIEVGRQLASALATVHAAGVVYRDLHVGNVLIARGEKPQAWIYDFDQSQVSPEFYARVTERWATPPEERVEPANEKPLQHMDYTAPEVRAGAAFTSASDVYALGLLLYRLLTGLRPFAPSGGAATPARKVCPACSAGLERLLLSMLNEEPSSRPTLAMVQATLEDEQAELMAECDTAEGERKTTRETEREEAPRAVLAPSPTAAASEVQDIRVRTAVEQDRYLAAVTDAAIGQGPFPLPARSAWRRDLFVVVLISAVSLMLGRATVDSKAAVQYQATAKSTVDAHNAPAQVAVPGPAQHVLPGATQVTPPGLAQDEAPQGTAEPTIPVKTSGQHPLATSTSRADVQAGIAARSVELSGCPNVPSHLTLVVDVGPRVALVEIQHVAVDLAVPLDQCVNEIVGALEFPDAGAIERHTVTVDVHDTARR